MELTCKEKIQNECKIMEKQRKQLEKLRGHVCEERIKLLNISKTIVREGSSRHLERSTEKLLNKIEANGSLFDLNVQRVQSDLIDYYSKLLKCRRQIDKLFIDNPYRVMTKDYQLLSESQKRLLDEITKVLVSIIWAISCLYLCAYFRERMSSKMKVTLGT